MNNKNERHWGLLLPTLIISIVGFQKSITKVCVICLSSCKLCEVGDARRKLREYCRRRGENPAQKRVYVQRERKKEMGRKERQSRKQLRLKTTHDKARTGCSIAPPPRPEIRTCVCVLCVQRLSRERESEVESLGRSQNTFNRFILKDVAKKQVSSLYT